MQEKEYIVEISVAVIYSGIYDARDEDEAIEMAKRDWHNQGEKSFDYYPGESEEFAAYES